MFLSAIIGPSSRLVLPLYFQSHGLTTAEVGFIMSVSGFAGLFSGVVAGKLSDTIGRKPVIVCGLLGYSIPWIMIWLLKNTIFYYIALIIEGFTLQMFFTAIFAFIADIFPPEQRGTAMGVWQSLFGIGMTIGQVFSVGFVYALFGPDLYFILMTLLHIAAGLVVFLFIKEPKIKHEQLNGVVKRPANIPQRSERSSLRLPRFSRSVIAYMASSILGSVGQTMILPIFSIFLLNLGISIAEMSVIYSAASVVNIVAPAIFGRLSDKFGRKKLLASLIVLSGITSLLYVLAKTFPLILTVRILAALALSATTPIGIAFLTELLPLSKQGFGIGFYRAFAGGGGTVWGAVGGVLVGYYGFNMVFLLGFATCLLSTVTLLFGVSGK
jgi:MFS family permease